MVAPAPPAFRPVLEPSTSLQVPVPAREGAAAPAPPHLFVEDSGASAAGEGASPLTCLCLPGIGDVRQQFRFLAPLLRSQGNRVLVGDLRGHGESSANFGSYTPLDVSGDIAAILDAASVPASVVLLANSLAASSALHFAAMHPDRVAAVICLAPVARDLPQDKSFRLLSHALFVAPWGVPLWVSYFDSLFKLRKPDDLAAYKAALAAKMREKGRLSALGQMIRGSKTPCFQEVGRVQCPVLLLHGEKDPDFASPAQEAEDVKAALTASKGVRVEVLSGVGHYPHVEEPQLSFDIISSFLKEQV